MCRSRTAAPLTSTLLSVAMKRRAEVQRRLFVRRCETPATTRQEESKHELAKTAGLG